MFPLVPPPAIEANDGQAIAELRRLYDVQRAASLANPFPSAAERA